MHFKTLFLCTALVTPAVSAQPTGTWGTPRQHDVSVAPGFLHAPPTGGMGQRFKALHIALIPQPSANAGLVIGWDSQDQNGSGGWWYQRWTVLDPSTDPPTILWNDELYIPGAGSGDLFCSGHAWTSDGRLFVAGGTSFYPNVGGGPFEGAKIALMFDPTPTGLEPYGRWSLLAPMAKDRWYPTVTLDGNGMMVVTGGSHLGGGENTYEVYDPATNTWQTDPATGNSFFPGPTGGAQLHNFRRMHVLSEGELFMSGPQTQAARVDHNLAPGVWTLTGQSSVHRHDGASILFPFPFNVPDVVVILGGSSTPTRECRRTRRS